MFKCLICNKTCKNNRSLGCHVRLHNITVRQYKENFGLIRICKKCGKEVSKNCKTNICNHCRDRSGKNNPFYGKKHKKESIEKAKIKCSNASKKNWENQKYRDKVIKATSKPRKKSFGEEQSKRVLQWYKDNPEQKEIRSKLMEKNWKEGKIVANGYSCNRSKMQEELLKDIEKIYGDKAPIRTIRLENGKYLFPDIFLDKIGLVIEFYGDYWHANPKLFKPTDIVHHKLTAKEIWDKDNERIRKFNDAIDESDNPVDYRTEIVWQSDYINNKKQVLEKLNILINYGGC